MKKLLLFSGILLGGAAAARFLPEKRREPVRRFAEKMRERVSSHMGSMMEKMPENSPPRLVMSTLPRLADQNDQILELLREQNDLMRELSAKR
ncbi:MAG: hypothetical protein JSU87_03195 [Gemmatimonadota bacterium]|nr:MAG: hypothetical protein JSU87_03195 [Gemmatimonadota bacterium]